MKENQIQLRAFSELDFLIKSNNANTDPRLSQENLHIHKECEIYINLSGDASFEVENTIYPVSKGSVIITRPYEYHHCIYHSGKLHRHYWILFSPEENSPLFRRFFQRNSGENNLIQLTAEELFQSMQYLDILLQKDETPLRQTIAFLQFLELLEQSENEAHTDALLSDCVRLALDYIEKHLSENITILQIAQNSYVSINTLERQFQKYLQASPQAILRKKRLIYSAKRLRIGDNVTQAWEKSGFSDYSHYITSFRKFFGMTPLKYQKQTLK